jgi:hypothetical protein
MFTYARRAAFLLLAANIAWTCAPLGWIAALLTNANAVLSAYVIRAHPSFASGQASATAIGGLDGEAGDALVWADSAATAGASSLGRSSFFDPASDAARGRVAGRY